MTNCNKLLSVIIPAYNECNAIDHTFSIIKSILNSNHIPFEIIFIDDGFTDGTFEKIKHLSAKNIEIKGISFSRNFGKESSLHSFCANCFYHIISYLSGLDMKNASDFKLLDKKAVEALLLLPERSLFFRGLSSWVGFKTITIPFIVQERTIGTSKWSAFKLFKYALNNITSFSGAPMQFVTFMGWIMLFLSSILGLNSLFQYFNGSALEGFTTVILLQLIIGSILMISLGIIGYYISKIYDEIKARPRYLISERCGY